MRTITTAALMMATLAAAPAGAQAPAAGAAGPAPAKLCTTATTVVRRGDVVVGDNTSTRCEDDTASAPTDVCTTSITIVRRGGVVVSSTGATKCEDETAAGGGVTAKAVFGAPAGALSAVGKGFLAGGGDRATASNVRGDWKVMDSRADRVCHLFLTSQPDSAGFRVRRTDCKGLFAQVQAWTFEGEGVALHEAGGGVVITLTGSRAQLQGRTTAGKPVLIAR